MSVDRQRLHALLTSRFGHDRFRPGQERLIGDALAGRDALAVLPTGSGKSLVYQLASQLLPGLTIVVSPLLALMKDQVDSLQEHGLDADVIGSLQVERSEDARLLYVTPERFDDEAFVAELRSRQVSLFVVDEAHSISEWGQSFRPAYLGLATAAERVGRPAILALTATASPWLRREIIDRLRLREPDLVVHGVDRPNLFFEVIRVEDEHEDRRVLEQLLASDDGLTGSGIVYTQTTRAAEDTAAWLQGWGIAAEAYHGRRAKRDRTRVQDQFLDGTLRVITATNAFGLGIDKPDVRFVIHRDTPGSLEAYYQEAGRAGRDGQPARCTLIYRPGDLGRAAFLSSGGELTREEVSRARPGLVKQHEGTWAEMLRASGLGRGDFTRLVDILVQQRVLQRRRGRLRLLVADFDAEAVPLEREAARRAYERSRLEMLRSYAETRDCRRAFLLSYFGEVPRAAWCGRCDNDLAPPPAASPEAPASPYHLQQRVRHPRWGEGTIQRLTADTLTVLFDEVGYKTLALDLVQDQELLAPMD